MSYSIYHMVLAKSETAVEVVVLSTRELRGSDATLCETHSFIVVSNSYYVSEHIVFISTNVRSLFGDFLNKYL